MASWDIDPPGVSKVVTTVGGHVVGPDGKGGSGLAKEIKDFGTHVGNAAESAASMPVGTALKEFVEHYSKNLKAMADKTGSCASGAVEATKAYINGDHEMALEAQQKAVDAPAPQLRRPLGRH